MNNYQSSLTKKQSIETQKLNEPSYGIIKSLLSKYRPSDGLRNIHGGKEESKGQIAVK